MCETGLLVTVLAMFGITAGIGLTAFFVRTSGVLTRFKEEEKKID